MNPFDEIDIEDMFKKMMRSLSGKDFDENLDEEDFTPDHPEKNFFHISYRMNSNMDSPEIRVNGNLTPNEFMNHFQNKTENNEEKQVDPQEIFTDIFDRDDQLLIVMEIPGIQKNEIDLNIENNTLELFAREIHKSVELPVKVDENSAKARYTNGILEIRFNKLVSSQEKTKIAID